MKVILKFAFAFGLIYWLIKDGKLDFSLIKKSLDHGNQIYICFGLIILQASLAALRWGLILRIKSTQKISKIKVIGLSWIGMFFSSVLPGSVTGDLVKMFMAKDLDPKLERAYLFTSVLLDRVFGLIGLLLLMGIMTLISYGEMLVKFPKAQSIFAFNALLFLGVIFFFASLFLGGKTQNIILNVFKSTFSFFSMIFSGIIEFFSSLIPHGGLQDKVNKALKLLPLIEEKIIKVFIQYWEIGKNKKTVLFCVLFSIIGQCLLVVAFYTIAAPFIPSEISLKFLMSLIPLGLITTAIPIAPAGMGVGHAVFDKIFGLVNVNNGASLFNIYWLCYFTINLLGIFPFLRSKTKIDFSFLKKSTEEN